MRETWEGIRELEQPMWQVLSRKRQGDLVKQAAARHFSSPLPAASLFGHR